MGCGNSKETVNTNAHGKGKVGSDKNGNIKNSQVRGKALYHTKAASSIHLMSSGFNIIMQDLANAL